VIQVSELVNTFLNEAIHDLVIEMFQETELTDDEFDAFKAKMLKEVVLQELIDNVLKLSE
jgi:hypothetical protein|tara:strand:+ start:3819 stop:3998 length:180 start_codon:yes stop_codon:yes gene_type:complete